MIVTIGGIPVYDAIITDEETGMVRISLVDDPAVMSNFQAFDAQKPLRMYAVQDEEKRLVRGVIMRSDFPIYRRDKELGEYYVIYKADTIRQMAEKYLAESRQNILNAMHRGEDLPDIYMVQYFIKGDGVSVDGFDDIADGSLFGEFHIVNDAVWEEVKAGTYKGFSLEGYFDLVPETDVAEVKDIVETLEGKFEKILSKIKTPMSKLKKLFAALTAYLQMGNVTTDKGILAWDGEEDLKAGDPVYILDQEGNRQDAEDGEYKTEDNKVIVVADGKVAEIRDAEAEVAPQEEAKETRMLDTDKGKLEWDNEDEDLKAGDAVYITDEEGNRNPAPDGDYTTNDGKVIKVVDGKVSEIVDPKAEVSEEGKKQSRFARIKQAFEESFDEKMQRIREAIFAVRGEGYEWYLAEAGEDYAVIAAFDPETFEEHFFRYAIAWNEDGTATASGETEVKRMYVPMDYESPFAKEETEAIRQENASLKAELARMKAKPAAAPAHQEYNEAGKSTKTGIKGLDRLSRLVDAGK